MKRVVTSLIVSTMISTLSIATSPLIKFSDVYSKTKVTLVNPSSNLQNPWGDASIWGNFNVVSMDLKKKKEINPWTGTTFYVGYAGTTGDSFLTNLTMGSTARYTFSYDLFNVLKLNYMFNSSQKSGMTANNYNITNYLIHTFDSY
ncbi:MAG: hypothetical protein NTX05_08605, partial [Fusobacteria bacterium]|nr:hypothetical protein [Fusobacteriota bacterium]